MNVLPETEAEWLAFAANLPKPGMSAHGRQRSLAAALAALPEDQNQNPRRRGWISIHSAGWAACWLIGGLLWLDAPAAPPPTGQNWQQDYTDRPRPQLDPDTAILLATLYPNDTQARFRSLAAF